AVLQPSEHRTGAVPDPQLSQNARHVVLDGADAHDEGKRNLPIAVATRQQAQHMRLALRQRHLWLLAAQHVLALAHGLQQALGDRRLHVAAAPGYLSDRREQLLEADILQQVTASTRAQSL